MQSNLTTEEIALYNELSKVINQQITSLRTMINKYLEDSIEDHDKVIELLLYSDDILDFSQTAITSLIQDIVLIKEKE